MWERHFKTLNFITSALKYKILLQDGINNVNKLYVINNWNGLFKISFVLFLSGKCGAGKVWKPAFKMLEKC